jgi:phosphoribosylglycinamide formyltransferase-1
VLVSGTGSNLQSLIDTVHEAEDTPARIVLVVASRADAPALARASRAGIGIGVVTLGDDTREGRDRRLAAMVAEADPDLIVMAGWMSIVTGEFLDRFPDKVINLHPSLLPAFAGLHAIEQALEWGVRLTGVTVHYAEETVDSGPPIMQQAVPVRYGDTPETLGERVHAAEHELLPRVVRAFAGGRVHRDREHPRQVRVEEGS